MATKYTLEDGSVVTIERPCASCLRGVSDPDDPKDFKPEEADCYVEGKIPSDSRSGWTPYRAYLCWNHMEMMEEDGAEFKVVRKVNS